MTKHSKLSKLLIAKHVFPKFLIRHSNDVGVFKDAFEIQELLFGLHWRNIELQSSFPTLGFSRRDQCKRKQTIISNYGPKKGHKEFTKAYIINIMAILLGFAAK